MLTTKTVNYKTIGNLKKSKTDSIIIFYKILGIASLNFQARLKLSEYYINICFIFLDKKSTNSITHKTNNTSQIPLHSVEC